jgi:RNA polymerase sigma factor (sigma-70 family)
MVEGKKNTVARQNEALRLSETLTALSDNQLLCRFRNVQDETRESAFREVVHRHGPMVMGVCRQVLRHPHDAEDAFQATFLVLVVKARSIRVTESLAAWLHSVAYRTAQRARTTSSRYRQGDREEMEVVETAPQDPDHGDILRLLQEELGRLPNKYRVPIVLCHLEGKTHEEAARLLDWPVGTVSGRLSRGRELLKARLERRGFAVTSAVILIPWLELVQSVPISSIESALTAVTRFTAAKSVSASVLSLTRGVLKTMVLNRLRTISLAVLLTGVVSGGVWAHIPSQSRRHDSRANELALTSTNEATTAPVATSSPSQQPAAPSSADCPLAWTEGAPPGCPIAMAANAVGRIVGYFHGDGSASSR